MIKEVLAMANAGVGGIGQEDKFRLKFNTSHDLQNIYSRDPSLDKLDKR
jgi:hypothetical protein